MVSIEIPGTGGSTLSKAGRHNWRVVRTAYQGAVDAGIAEWREAVNTGRLDGLPWTSVEVTGVQFWCGRPKDHDNLAVVIAPYIDAAVHAGIIPDDSPDYVKRYVLKHEKVAKKADRKIRITIATIGE